MTEERGAGAVGVPAVLLIEDEDALRGGVARYLRREGFIVHEASDGSKAVRLLDVVHSVDLVITDINMPEADGLEVIRSLRRAGMSIPIIAMSGGGIFPKSTLLALAGYLGATATLQKPFALDELRDLARRMLEMQ